MIIGCEDKNEIYQNEGGLIDGIYTVYAGNMYYNPSTISITEGDSIRFINDNGFHDVKKNFSTGKWLKLVFKKIIFHKYSIRLIYKIYLNFFF